MTSTSTQLKLLTPLESPLPPQRGKDPLTESQWTTLLSIADTIIPAINAPNEQALGSLDTDPERYSNAASTINGSLVNDDSILTSQYLREKPSSVPAFKDLLGRTISDYLRADAKKGIGSILNALEYGHTSLGVRP